MKSLLIELGGWGGVESQWSGMKMCFIIHNNTWHLYNAKSKVYSKALFRLINMRLNVAELKAYFKGTTGCLHTTHIWPRSTCSLARSWCWFYEGKKQEINNSTHISSKFDKQHGAILPGGHPSSYNPTRLGSTSELSSEKQRANRICHSCLVNGDECSIYMVHSDWLKCTRCSTFERYPVIPGK